MRRMFGGLPILIVALLAIAWFSKARHFTTALDGLIKVRRTSLPVRPLRYNGEGLVVGLQPLVFASLDNQRADMDVSTDPANRVVLRAGSRRFVLGSRTDLTEPSRWPEIVFEADPGDEILLRSSGSLVSWPTPFTMNVMGGASSRWRRFAYFELLWTKRSGAKLEMRWRYEQEYYKAKGWTAPLMMWNSRTGLLSVKIV